ncbi:hypothetical protein QL285_026703 [Trifolium repens]|nr:hypothetical protein QL285_026703 [Trifolium repens]
MTNDYIAKANSGLARLKRKRTFENKTHFTRSTKRSVTSSSSPANSKASPHVSTAFADVTNTHQLHTPLEDLSHSKATEQTQPNLTEHHRNTKSTSFIETNYSRLNLLNKFSATTNDKPSSSNVTNESILTPPSPPNDSPPSPPTSPIFTPPPPPTSPIFTPPSPPTPEQYFDSGTESDSEVEIYLDENSSESEQEVEENHHQIRNNLSYTMTGNPAFQGNSK